MSGEHEPLEWLTFGITLTLTPTEEGGRRKPVGISGKPYEPFAYRPNWGLPGMKGADQTGAMVVSFAHVPFAPGETDRAVIVPFVPGSLPLWEEVRPGDHLRAYEGARVVGNAIVEWVARRENQRPTEEQVNRFTAWAEGHQDAP